MKINAIGVTFQANKGKYFEKKRIFFVIKSIIKKRHRDFIQSLCGIFFVTIQSLCGVFCLWFLLIACNSTNTQQVDELNDLAYENHYRNLQATQDYALEALELAGNYSSGKAEALNNLAFVSIAKMDYLTGDSLIKEALDATENKIEQFISLVLGMQLCQKQSRNKEFYDYVWHAHRRKERIEEEQNIPNERLKRRITYAITEYSLVLSEYYNSVGKGELSAEALTIVDWDEAYKTDIAQYLKYLCTVGSGGIITEDSETDIYLQENENLLRCYFMAKELEYPYFQAKSLMALAEHFILQKNQETYLSDVNSDENIEELDLKQTTKQSIIDHRGDPFLLFPDTIKTENGARWLAEEALNISLNYGDVYQISMAESTLGTCFLESEDYDQALYHLEQALADSAVNLSANLVVRIRERLCVAYSALDNKVLSDYNRNIYNDLQDQTRQDRLLESRAGMLFRATTQLNVVIVAMILAIIVMLFLLWLFHRLNRLYLKRRPLELLIKPLLEWEEKQKAERKDALRVLEDIEERRFLCQSRICEGARRATDNRTKASLATSIMSLIDQMVYEIRRIVKTKDWDLFDQRRRNYIRELIDAINKNNEVLAQCIQIHGGKSSVRVESFALQPLLDIVYKSHIAFEMKGINLEIMPSCAIIKADRTLTLFMINTLVDNARKYTKSPGCVKVSTKECDNMVEISVEDTGEGIEKEKLASLFSGKDMSILPPKESNNNANHGFGLANCRSIMDMYAKTSRLFSHCKIDVESERGKGSRFFFTLPRGTIRTIMLLFLTFSTIQKAHTITGNESQIQEQFYKEEEYLPEAKAWADSAYFSNIDGTYNRTLVFADSCLKCLNAHYLQQNHKNSALMVPFGDITFTPAEIKWLRDSVLTSYEIILDIRNEMAIAALSLHRWRLYSYNDQVYRQLFRELSADNTLEEYCRIMQQKRADKTVAIVMLSLILLIIPLTFYFFYWRNVLYFRYCEERVKKINVLLLSDLAPQKKLFYLAKMVNEDWIKPLDEIVNQIFEALKDACAHSENSLSDIENALVKLNVAERDEAFLHVNNAISDNCFSLLKHETMYHPARIETLLKNIDAKNDENKKPSDDDLQAIIESVKYYHKVFSLLFERVIFQCGNIKAQVKAVKATQFSPSAPDDLYLLVDAFLIEYLFDILKHQGASTDISIAISACDDRYVTIIASLPYAKTLSFMQENPFIDEIERAFLRAKDSNKLSSKEPKNKLLMDDLPWLLCRQIIRDHSEATNYNMCGISFSGEDREKKVTITLPRFIEHTEITA